MTTAYGTERETKIKICGLRRLEDAQIVNAVQAQYGGFVFAKSKRQVTMAQAQQLREVLLPSGQTVGVIVDAAPAEIAALCQQGIIDIVQFHGHEDAAYIQQLRALIQAPIVKAVQVRSAEVVLQAQQLDCDYLLLDTYIPGVAGGSGQQFDYQQIPPLYKPFFLAGGLTPENVQQAIQKVHPYAVDVSSGVEENGWKSAEKIKQFVQMVRSM